MEPNFYTDGAITVKCTVGGDLHMYEYTLNQQLDNQGC